VNQSVHANDREYNQAMLDKPEVPDETIIACLQVDYGLMIRQIEFLPLGVDRNSAVYRAVDDGQTTYFVKLRHGIFNETSVTLPRYLSDQGLRQIIAPLKTRTGKLWANLADFKIILYPYVEGQNGYQVDLSNQHWVELGQAVKHIQSSVLPDTMAASIKRETYSPQTREALRMILNRIDHTIYTDTVSIKLAAFLKSKRGEILELIAHAGRCAHALHTKPPINVLCHSDLHAGNILIDGNGGLFIVDWDDPIFAPKERDLMFVGGGQGFRGHTSREEEALFYQGYGRASINEVALAYYRYERIIQDIAAFYEQILSSDKMGEDREQCFQYLTSNFLPGNTIDIAYQSDKTLASG
jgi:spectinomycin phosphotransferase